MMDFQGQVVIVTGSGSPRGIGKTLAMSLAKLGANIVVADMNLPGAQDVANEITNDGGHAIAVQVNVFDEASVQKMVDTTLEKYGKIDVLCNNAGITQPISTMDMTKEDFMRIVNINLVGTFLCSKAVIPAMIKNHYGRIVNTSSVSAKCGGGVFGGSHYCAAKAGILGFAKALAMEVVADGITVNSVCPGAISTDIRVGISEEKEALLSNNNPMKRIGTAQEVANTIIFLCSKEASYITGEDININGGSYLG